MAEDIGKYSIGVGIDVSQLTSGLNNAVQQTTQSTNSMVSVFNSMSSGVGASIASVNASLTSLSTSGLSAMNAVSQQVEAAAGRVSGGLTLLQTNASSSMQSTASDFEAAAGQHAAVVRDMSIQEATYYDTLGKESSKATESMQAGLGSLPPEIETVSSSMQNLSQTMQPLQNAGMYITMMGVAIGALGEKFIDVDKGAVEMASTFEDLGISMEVMTGSAAKGNELLEKIKEYAIKTPFTTVEITEATQSLLAYGVPLKDMMWTIKTLGDISGGSAEKLNQLTYAYARTASEGSLSGMTMKMFRSTSFNPLAVIAQRTGESMIEIKKRMSEGKVSIDEVNQAMVDATSEGGRFFGMLEKKSQTFSGLMSTLKDDLQITSAVMGDAFLPTLKTVEHTLITLTSNFRELPVWIQQTIGVTIGLTGVALVLTAGLLVLVGLLPMVVMGMAALLPATMATTAAFGGLAGSAGILGGALLKTFTAPLIALGAFITANALVITAILALIAIGVLLYEGYTHNWHGMKDAVDDFTNQLKTDIDYVIEKIKEMINWFQKGNEGATKFLGQFGGDAWTKNINWNGPDIMSKVSGGETTNEKAGVYGGHRLSASQLANARTIANVGYSRGASEKDVATAIATAMQESGLQNITHGDSNDRAKTARGVAGYPDAGSLGLFQQRGDSGWGSRGSRLDPEQAANKFYDHLLKLPNRDSRTLTQNAQRVQGSDYPNAYQPWANMASDVAKKMKPNDWRNLTSPKSSQTQSSKDSSDDKPPTKRPKAPPTFAEATSKYDMDVAKAESKGVELSNAQKLTLYKKDVANYVKSDADKLQYLQTTNSLEKTIKQDGYDKDKTHLDDQIENTKQSLAKKHALELKSANDELAKYPKDSAEYNKALKDKHTLLTKQEKENNDFIKSSDEMKIASAKGSISTIYNLQLKGLQDELKLYAQGTTEYNNILTKITTLKQDHEKKLSSIAEIEAQKKIAEADGDEDKIYQITLNRINNQMKLYAKDSEEYRRFELEKVQLTKDHEDKMISQMRADANIKVLLAKGNADQIYAIEVDLENKIMALHHRGTLAYKQDMADLLRLEQDHSNKILEDNRTAVKQQETLSDIQASMEDENVRHEVAMHKGGEDEMIAADIASENRHYQIHLDEMNKEAALDKGNVDKYKQDLNAIEVAEAQHSLKILQLNNKLVESQKSKWQELASSIGQSFQSHLTGLLNGTENFKDAMKGMFQDIVSAVVKMVTDMAAKWLQGMITMTVAGKACSGAQCAANAATGASNIALTTQKVAQNAQVIASNTVMSTQQLAGSAQCTAANTAVVASSVAMTAGVTASTAGLAAAAVSANIAAKAYADLAVSEAAAAVAMTPIVGPAMAAASSASVSASILAAWATLMLPGFETGTTNVPRDMIAQIHKGEMIVPKTYAEGQRELMMGRGSTTNNSPINLNISALDAKSVKDFFKDNGQLMTREIQRQNKRLRIQNTQFPNFSNR